jgi:hypothetical protein
MIWEPVYDFIFAILEGSEFAILVADITALIFTMMIFYFLILFPIQLFVRTTIRMIAAATGTPAWFSLKKKYNKAPKE